MRHIVFKKTLLIALFFSLGTLTAAHQTETPSGVIYPTPVIEFSSFNIYDKETKSSDIRPGSPSTLPRSTTTYVYAEIELKNYLYQVRDQDVTLTFKYYLENGTLLTEFDTVFSIKRDWEFAWYYDSWGWEAPGNWPVGTHRIEVWIGGTRFVVKKFTISNN